MSDTAAPAGAEDAAGAPVVAAAEDAGAAVSVVPESLPPQADRARTETQKTVDANRRVFFTGAECI
ncbi:hypothetical protein JCM9533A_84590 [Catenuloplanes niger JCM 9533]